MKVGFILRDFRAGGVEMVTFRLLEGLKKYDEEIKLSFLYFSEYGTYRKHFPEGVEARKVKGVFSLVKNENLDVFIISNGALGLKLKLASLFLGKKIKIIAVQHIPIILPSKSFIFNVIRQTLGYFYFKSANYVVTVSEGIKEGILSLVNIRHKIKVIYNPVLDNTIKLKAQEPNHLNFPYFVNLARLEYQKNQADLVKIFSEYLQKSNDKESKLLILGEGELKDELASQIKQLYLEGRIQLLGNIDNPYPYLDKAKGLLLTSRWEGLPTVIIESHYLNTPVIAYDCPTGPFELLAGGKYGKLIPLGNHDKFVQALLESDKLSFTLPKDFIENFTIRKSSECYKELLDIVKNE